MPVVAVGVSIADSVPLPDGVGLRDELGVPVVEGHRVRVADREHEAVRGREADHDRVPEALGLRVQDRDGDSMALAVGVALVRDTVREWEDRVKGEGLRDAEAQAVPVEVAVRVRVAPWERDGVVEGDPLGLKVRVGAGVREGDGGERVGERVKDAVRVGLTEGRAVRLGLAEREAVLRTTRGSARHSVALGTGPVPLFLSLFCRV